MLIGGCVVSPLVLIAWSFGSYVFVDNGDTVQQRCRRHVETDPLSALEF
jgi:hypothetical protein